MDGGPGVIITEWISNGTDFLADNILLPTTDLRLYPTDLVRTDGDITYRAYRLILSYGRQPVTVGLFPEANDYWLSIDSGIYNNQPIDGFVVAFNKDGVVQSVFSDGLQVNLPRSSTLHHNRSI